MGRLVEAVHGFDLGQKLRVYALGRPGIATGRDFTPASTAGPGQGAATMALHFRKELLDRPPGGGLDDDKIEQHDPEQGRYDQCQTPENIAAHSDCQLRRSGK